MNFDLNINNYKKEELRDMFDLPATYSQDLLDSKESYLKKSILADPDVKEETKKMTLYFLTEAKKILLGDVYEKVANIESRVEDYFNSIYDLKPTAVDEVDDHMVQVRKNRPYLTSYPGEFFPGIINPIKRRTNRQSLNIDTRFRENYYGSSASNFNITLPLIINNVLTMQLVAIELPSSFYSVSKQLGCNFFHLVVNGVSAIITVPDGNYTSSGIVNVLNSIVSNLATTDPTFANFQYIDFAINNTDNNGSGQMVVGVDASAPPSTITFSLNFQMNKYGEYDATTPLPLKLGWILGFRNGVYENNINYVSEGVVDLTGPRYVYLVVDDFNNNVNNGFYSAFNSSILNKNILARISLQGKSFTIINENNLNVVTSPRQYFGPVKIQNLNIQLLDEYGRVLELNNMDYSFSLTFQIAYDL